MIRSRDDEKAAPALARRTAREGRTFALTLAAGFFFFAFIGQLRNRHAVAIAALALSLISLFAALLIPGRLEPVRRSWMKLGDLLGHVTTPILMGIVYYLFVSPIGFIRRLTTTRSPANDPRWHKRPPLPEAKRMERQF